MIMKYLTTLFWGFCIGQAVNYIGSALTDGTYNFTLATIIGLIGGLIVIALGQLLTHSGEETTIDHDKA